LPELQESEMVAFQNAMVSFMCYGTALCSEFQEVRFMGIIAPTFFAEFYP
jgi:hypothetical protein